MPSSVSELSIVAVLAAGCPDAVPFMADESVVAVPEITVLKYDLNCYMQFADGITSKLKWLQKTGE